MKHLALLVLLLLTFSYQALAEVFHGEMVPIGNGMGHTYIKTDSSKKPIAIGIALSEEAMNGLPTVPTVFSLKLPFALEPYNEILVDWNPQGHEPPEIYGLPHFDFHFYIIPQDEREGISCMGEDLGACTKKPIDAFIPPYYVPTPAGVPMMGWHWLDSRSPELNGQKFTSTFIYGFYKGEMIFLEPMITREFFMNKGQVNQQLSRPKKYAFDGYYPKRYSVTFDATTKLYHIEMAELELRETK